MSLPKSIVFFGDGSNETQTALDRILLAQEENTLLSLFLNRVRVVLQEEYQKLSPIDREEIPSFHDLFCLVRKEHDDSRPHPALHPTELVLVQLAYFIASYERRPQVPFPDAESNIIVGLCFGELPAAAVSLAKNLTELLPLAVEAVRVAFRAGIIINTTGKELEQQSEPAESWSIALSRESGIADGDTLKDICKEIGILERKWAYITALSPKTVTIGAPPSTLRKLIDYLEKKSNSSKKLNPHRVHIYAPYHAPRLYSKENILKVLDDLPSLDEAFDSNELASEKRTLIGAVSGEFYSASSRRNLLEQVLYNVLSEPIYWERVLDGCKSHVGSSQFSNWVVRPFGPANAAQSLVATLKAEGNVEVHFDEDFGSVSDDSAKPQKPPLAIVGMAGRFPESNSPDELWKILEDGLDCHKVIPIDRFNAETHLSKARFGCFMKTPGNLDARFFNLSPREALQTDPGQRLALVTAYEALEMSGWVPNRTPSTQLERIGTFYGQTSDEYKEQNMGQEVGTYYIPGGIRAFGPGRINHHFKFGGPANNVDTACSSSLVALQMACNSIWGNECDTAIAGGMNLLSGANDYEGLSSGHFLSSTGGCKTYDDAADGYCRGEAVGSVVVKRLDAAQADNDNILAVILGTATNYSADSISITHPHGPTQEVLYRQVLNEAGIRPFDVDYIEMHGTGTQAGDAVEMSSVSNVFAPESPARPRDKPLYVGAVKANLGHGESASGVTALIKTLLVLREQRLPPHVGIKGKLNHTFPDLDKRNLRITMKSSPFPLPEKYRRRALVNNFSAAGGNTALLLEEGPRKNVVDFVDPRPDHVVNVTAKTLPAIQKNIQNLLAYIDSNEVSLTDLSYTTTARRIQHPLRTSVVASTIDQLKDRLSASLANEDFKAPTKCSGTVFAFTGQGALYPSLGKALFELSGLYREDLLRFDQISQSHGFPTFLPVIDGSVSDVHSLAPTQTQLAITATQMGLCRLWASWGFTPDAVIGHSLGEYAALYASGVLSASDTLYLVGKRAKILEATCSFKTHSMLAVSATIDAIKDNLGASFKELEVACINGPEAIVISGAVKAIEEADKSLKSHKIKCTILNVPFAFHSSQVEPIMEPFEEAASTVQFMKPSVPLASPLLGTVIRDAGIIGPSYLKRHAREPVDFVSALRQCEKEHLSSADSVWLEIGPHPICLGMVKSTLGTKIRGVGTLRNNENPWTTACKSLSSLHSMGLNISWNEYHRDFEHGQHLLVLPSYAFDEKSYWIEYKNDWLLRKNGSTIPDTPQPAVPSGPATTTVQRLISEEERDGHVSCVFETDIADSAMHSTIIGHLINGSGLCPASVYADIALTVADYIRRKHKVQVPHTGLNVIDMEIPKPITITKARPEKPQLVRISANADLENGKVEIEYSKYSADTKKSDPGAKCLVEYGNAQKWLDQWQRTAYLVRKRLDALESGVKEGTTDKILRGMAYKLFAGLVLYEPRYQGMQEVLLNTPELEASALLKLYDGQDGGNFFCSPFWIDSFAHLAGFVMNANDTIDAQSAIFISHGWGSMRFAQEIDPKKPYRVHTKMQPIGKSMVGGDVSIFQGTTMVGHIGDMRFQQVPRALLDSMLPSAPSAQPKRQNPAKASAPPPSSAPKKTSSASQSGVTSKILNVIAEEVGIPAKEMSDDSKFSELGVDSLLSLTILSKLRETLQTDLPQTTFQDCETVGDLKSQLKISEGPSDEPKSAAPKKLSSAPPREDATSKVLSLIAEEVGMPTSDMTDDSKFSELGVDSLLSLTILSKLRETLQTDLPQNTFQDCETVGDLRRQLKLSDGSDEDSGEATATPDTSSGEATPEPIEKSEPVIVDDTISILRSTMAEQIGVEIEELQAADDLATLGVDSLMGLSILGALREKTGLSIPNDAISSNMSLAGIEKTIAPQSAPAKPKEPTKSKPATKPKAKAAPLSFLLQGSMKNASKNVFLFPDGSGSATSYEKMPEIAPGVALYGLNSPYLRETEEYTKSIEEITAGWVAEIRNRQPKGPYIIGGWSAGGYYTYEACKQLIEAGEIVERLILIDSPCRVVYEPIPFDVLDYLAKNGLMGGSPTKSTPSWLVDHFTSTIKAVENYKPTPLDPLKIPKTFIIWASEGVVEDLDGAKMDLDLSIKVSRFLLQRKTDFGPQGWEKLLSKEAIHTATMPGTHFTIVQKPNCDSMSRLIADALHDDPSQWKEKWMSA